MLWLLKIGPFQTMNGCVNIEWRNDRVYVKIVLYSSVTSLSEGKMAMNEL